MRPPLQRFARKYEPPGPADRLFEALFILVGSAVTALLLWGLWSVGGALLSGTLCWLAC